MKETAARPLTAVFFVDPTPLSAAPLHAWLAAGHRVAAVAVYHEVGHSPRMARERFVARLAPRWSVTAATRRHRIPFIELSPPLDWDALADRLAALGADVLVSIGFPRLVPGKVTATFRHGGVNIHPSLLPAYRGPQPFHAVVRDQAAGRYGGLTLHVMSERFDCGAIIAQAAAGEAAYRQRPETGFAFGRLAARLVSRDLPRYCTGDLLPVTQAGGVWPEAYLEPGPLVLEPDADLKRLRAVLSMFVPSPGVAVKVGERTPRIAALSRVLGPPSGQPPVLRRRTLDMDLADARVRLWRDERLLRHWRRLREVVALMREPVSV